MRAADVTLLCCPTAEAKPKLDHQPDEKVPPYRSFASRSLAGSLAMSATATQGSFGSYRLLRVVSEGPRGTVHEGIDPQHPGERVAIRAVPAASLGRPDTLQRMRRAAFAATDLRHPNILALHDCGEQDGMAFVATEFVDGDTLAQHLDQVGRLPALQGVALAAQLLSALDFVHRRQLVHGAIHPGNLLVSRTGQLKMAGLGWAAAAAPGPKQPGPFGDRAYLAPEQLGGASADPLSDLYGAARVVHELLAGRLAVAHACAPHALTAQVRAVFDRALAQDPRERYSTAADLSAALQAAVGAPMWERPPANSIRVEGVPLVPAVTPPVPADSSRQSGPTVQPEQRVDVPAVRDPHAVATRSPKPLSTRVRRTLGAAAAALILIAVVFMARDPAPAPPGQDTVQQPKPTAQVEVVREVQVELESRPAVDPAALATPITAPALERPDPPGERMPLALASSEESAMTPSTAMPVPGPAAPPAPVAAPEQQAAVRQASGAATSAGRSAVSRREPSARSDASASRASARTAAEPNGQRTARARRGAEVMRSAQRPSIGLACDQALAIGREVCRAVRCVSPEFRRHPVCVRLDVDRRARDAEREWRGSN